MQNPLPDADIGALLCLLATVEDRVGHACDTPLAQQLRDGFAACGLLPSDARPDSVGTAVAQLHARFRYSLGEYSERPIDLACEGQDS